MKLLNTTRAVLLCSSLCFGSLIQLNSANAQSFPRVMLSEVEFSNPAAAELSQPVQVVNAGDGTHRLFIVQKEGSVKVLDRADDDTFTDQGYFFTIDGILTSGEQGLLSMAFDPAFSENKRFYVFYTNADGDLELARYQTGDDPDRFDPATRQVLLTIPHPGENNHNGGEMHFGPDQMLYLSTGDGGGSGDPSDNAQNPASLLGKILRIDVNEPDLIPADNPVPGSLVYASGLRNPFRWSFDRDSGNLWIGDVGQNSYEEINTLPFLQLRGANFGWRCYEGNNPYNLAGCGDPDTYVFPIHTYETGSTNGRSVIGGVIYRGNAFPALQGYYIGADYYNNALHIIRQTGSSFSFNGDSEGVAGIADFGEAENGEVYAVRNNTTGVLYRVVPDPSLPVKFVDVSVSETAESTALLTWTSMQSDDLLAYQILRSTDGLQFSEIMTVAGEVTGDEPTAYSVRDSDIGVQQMYYYRIKALAHDGTFLYSLIVSFFAKAGAGDPYTNRLIFPNIIEDGRIDIMLPEPFEYMELVSLSGQPVQKFDLGRQTGKVRLKAGYIAPGLYLARFFRRQEVTVERVIFP